MLIPKLWTTLKGYQRADLAADLLAGLVVGIVALPLCIAFAIASGVTPERGLYTGIVAGFLISALGGSRVQIGGPTGAFVVVVAGIVASHGIDGLIVATFLAGLILIGAGLARLGGIIKYIPFPVITGFTSGIAVIIFSQQINELLGLRLEQIPTEFFGKWASYLGAVGSVEPTTAALSLGTIALLVVWPRVSTRIPGPFVALVVGTVVVHVFNLPVATIGSRFGPIDASFPHPVLPTINEKMVVELVGPALTIAFLAAIESLLSAVVADGMIGSRHRSNMELVAQGVANIASPIFGGIPATGAIARTATNVRNGGRTPVAGIVHAATLLLITLFAGRWAQLIPMATLAGILVVVAYHMSEWRTFRAELRAPRADAAVLVTTFGLTVLVDLPVAIAVGMVLAAFLFMKRMAETSTVEAISRGVFEDSDDRTESRRRARRAKIPRDVEVYDINGPFFFGAAESFKDTMRQIHWKPRALILDMADVPVIDSTGLRALLELTRQTEADGTTILLADLTHDVRAAIAGSPLGATFGPEQLHYSFDDALESLVTGSTQTRPSERHSTP